jgi:hypothetical protein
VWELVDISVERRLQGTVLEGTTVDWAQPWGCQPMCMASKEEHIQAAAHSQQEEVLRGVTTLCIQPMAFQEAGVQDRHMEVVVHQEVEAHQDSQEVADHQEEDHQDHQEVVVVAVAVEVSQTDQE